MACLMSTGAAMKNGNDVGQLVQSGMNTVLALRASKILKGIDREPSEVKQLPNRVETISDLSAFVVVCCPTASYLKPTETPVAPNHFAIAILGPQNIGPLCEVGGPSSNVLHVGTRR